MTDLLSLESVCKGSILRLAGQHLHGNGIDYGKDGPVRELADTLHHSFVAWLHFELFKRNHLDRAASVVEIGVSKLWPTLHLVRGVSLHHMRHPICEFTLYRDCVALLDPDARLECKCHDLEALIHDWLRLFRHIDVNSNVVLFLFFALFINGLDTGLHLLILSPQFCVFLRHGLRFLTQGCGLFV